MTPEMSRSQSEHASPMAGGGAVMIDASPGTWLPLQSHRRQNVTLINQKSPAVVLKNCLSSDLFGNVFECRQTCHDLSHTANSPVGPVKDISPGQRTNNTNMLIYCNNNIIKYINANKSHCHTFNHSILQFVSHVFMQSASQSSIYKHCSKVILTE